MTDTQLEARLQAIRQIANDDKPAARKFLAVCEKLSDSDSKGES